MYRVSGALGLMRYQTNLPLLDTEVIKETSKSPQHLRKITKLAVFTGPHLWSQIFRIAVQNLFFFFQFFSL